ncbi:MAG: MOSC domain-containing protein, partial [Chloroflexota bacterium]
ALISRRPTTDEREILQAAELDLTEGLVGDNWLARGSASMPDGSANPDAQLTFMNTRVIDLVAQDKARWHLAGDQIFVDLDLSVDNLPPGTQLSIGTTIIEVTPLPHTGCQKFVERFGGDAMKFVNSKAGRALRLRGMNAKVVQGGTIKAGDTVKKL